MGSVDYLKLLDRLNQGYIKQLPTQGMLDFLRDLFAEEQAALIIDFPQGSYTAKTLSEKLGRDEVALEKLLAQMSADGLIFETKNENGEALYAPLPLEPGLIELQYIKGIDDEWTRKLVELGKKVEEEAAVIMGDILGDPETAREMISKPHSRIVAIEENISEDKELADWEKLSVIIENETSYAVGECTCRHVAKIKGEPCKSEGPTKCCVWFGKMADYLIERDYAERYEKEDLYKLLKTCEEAGLVHFTTNRLLHDNIVLCNCCKCCCGHLKNNRAIREIDVKYIENTNFVARVDEDTCIGCGECVDYCQLEALSLVDDRITINEKYCLGCGACVSKCPTGSLSLVRLSHNKPPDPEPIEVAPFA